MYNVLWFLILIDFWLSAIINYQKLIHWVLPDLFLWDHKIKIKSVECGTQILLMIAFDQRMFCDCFWSVHVVWLIAYQIITKPVHTIPTDPSTFTTTTSTCRTSPYIVLANRRRSNHGLYALHLSNFLRTAIVSALDSDWTIYYLLISSILMTLVSFICT